MHRLAVLQTERRVQRTRIGLAIHERREIALLGLAEIVADEVERETAVIRRNREDFIEDRLEALVLTLGGRNVCLQEVLVRLGLDFDQVRRRRGHPLELAEYLAFCAHLVCPCWLFSCEKMTIGNPSHAPEVW